MSKVRAKLKRALRAQSSFRYVPRAAIGRGASPYFTASRVFRETWRIRRLSAELGTHAELAHAASQGAGVDVEDLCGAVGPVNLPTGVLQDLLDVVPLDIGELSARSRSGQLLGRTCGGRLWPGGDLDLQLGTRAKRDMSESWR